MEILFNNLDKLLDAPNGIEKARQLILQLAVQGKLTSKWRNSIFESHPELVSGSAKSVKLEDGTIYEPASELLKKIKEEKEKLIAEGKIKKQKELPPIKDEEKPFKLPRCWEWVRLGDSGLINPRNDIRDEIRVSFIPMALISDKYGESAKSETKSWVEVKKGFTHFAENDVGLAKITPCFENGKAAVFRNLTNGYGAGTTELHIFRRVENDMSSDYIYILIKSPSFVEGGKSQMTGTAGQQRVSKDYFQNYVFALPPPNEQKRIVEKVNSLMALLDELEEKRERRNQKRIKLNNASLDKLLTSKDDKELKTNWERIEENFSTLYSVPENVAKLKQAILQLAVQGKLVKRDPNDEPASELLKKIKKEKEKLIAEGKIKKQKDLPAIKEDEKPFELPKGWEWVRVYEIMGEAYTGIERSKAHQSLDNKYFYFKMNNIGNDGQCILSNMTKVNASDEEINKYKLSNGDFLFNTRNSYELVGKTCVYKNDKNEIVLFNNNIYRINFLEQINVNFINIFFNSIVGKEGLDKLKSSTTNVAAIYQGKLMGFLISLAPLNEQKRIVEKVNELMSLCNTLEEKLKKKEEKGERLVGAVVNGVTTN